MSLYAFTPESSTVYWLSPNHQEDLMDNHHVLESIEEITVNNEHQGSEHVHHKDGHHHGHHKDEHHHGHHKDEHHHGHHKDGHYRESENCNHQKVQQKEHHMPWPCSTSPKNLYEKVHEGCNYATVEHEMNNMPENKEMTWQDYKAELDAWLKERNGEKKMPRKKWKLVDQNKGANIRCNSLFDSPEQMQKFLILTIAIIFGFVLGRSI